MKLIMVAGLPSSGTSMVAGVLHHLGVNMGNLPTSEQEQATATMRHYRGFECEDAKRQIGGLPSTCGLEDVFSASQDYIEWRLATATGPAGVKLNLLAVLGLADRLEDLPLAVVHVTRDLETTFESDIKYTGMDIKRASNRGLRHLALRQLVRRVRPACVIRYELALGNPDYTVHKLADSLGLAPTGGHMNAAINFVNPITCKMEGITA